MSELSKGILYSKISGYLTTLTEDSLGFPVTPSSSILSNSPFIIFIPFLVTPQTMSFVNLYHLSCHHLQLAYFKVLLERKNRKSPLDVVTSVLLTCCNKAKFATALSMAKPRIVDAC